MKDQAEIEVMVAKLNAALVKNDVVTFMRTLIQIVEAQGGIDAVSKKGNLDRSQLELFLSEESKPKFAHIQSVLRALNMYFTLIEEE